MQGDPKDPTVNLLNSACMAYDIMDYRGSIGSHDPIELRVYLHKVVPGNLADATAV
jgi:hypothetical protein